MLRALACFSFVSLASLIGCAAQTDGAANTDTALGGDGPPPPTCTRGCFTPVREDAAMACYRAFSADIVVQGVHHRGTLYDQLKAASGIQNVQMPPSPTNVCASPSYNCHGSFYDALGRAIHAPLLPLLRSAADLTRWKASVAAFFKDAYLDPRAKHHLLDGQADVCTTAIEVENQSHPDPSIVAVLETLQKIGGQSVLGADKDWMRLIIAQGNAFGCPTPALDPNHDESSWAISIDASASFLAGYRDCALPDSSHVGGCPHSFDKPQGAGNFVMAHPLINACSFMWFVGDPTGGCGMSCYSTFSWHPVVL